MSNDFDDLYNRALKVFGGAGPSTAFGGVRAIIGPRNFPRGEDLAEQAMSALGKGIVPSPAQIAALETVIKLLRPSVLSQRALLNPLPPYQNYEPNVLTQWATFQANVKTYLYSVGRIDKLGGATGVDGLATGFIVAPGVLATNTHVLDAISANSRLLEKGQAVVMFGQEFQVVPDAPAVAITGVIAVHPTLDLSLLSVEDLQRPPWVLDPNPPQKTARVAVVGYPQDDPRSPVFRDVIFQGRFGVKRAAPGEVRGVGPDAVYHDCSTLGGNSGSPVVDLDTCKVVGIHRDGPLFLFRNEAVDGTSLQDFVNKN